MGKPLFKFFDVWSSQAAQFLSQLPMSPRLVEAARRSVGIMGSVAVRDRLCPLGRHFRELVQEFLPLFECRLSLEQLRESFPSLVVSVIVDVFERLLKSLQQWARDFRRLQRPNRLEPPPVLVHPVDGCFELDGIGKHGFFGLRTHTFGAWYRPTGHLSIPAFAQVLPHLTDLEEMKDRFEVLELFELTLIGLCFLGE